MSFDGLKSRFSELFGADVQVSFDDDRQPSRLMLYRYDPVSEDLVRDAVARATREFPAEMRGISDVFLSFEDSLGPTRRRYSVA